MSDQFADQFASEAQCSKSGLRVLNGYELQGRAADPFQVSHHTDLRSAVDVSASCRVTLNRITYRVDARIRIIERGAKGETARIDAQALHSSTFIRRAEGGPPTAAASRLIWKDLNELCRMHESNARLRALAHVEACRGNRDFALREVVRLKGELAEAQARYSASERAIDAALDALKAAR